MHSHSFTSCLASSNKVYFGFLSRFAGAILANPRSTQVLFPVSLQGLRSLSSSYKFLRTSYSQQAFSTRANSNTSRDPDILREHVDGLQHWYSIGSKSNPYPTANERSRRKEGSQYRPYRTILPAEKVEFPTKRPKRKAPFVRAVAKRVKRTRATITFCQRSKMARAMSALTPGERQKFHFQFVTTPTSDTPGTALLLHYDNKRYFFGRIAEGTQRACIQRGVGIKKVRNMFLTGPITWNSMGGLLGMVLTMADVQLEEVDPITGKRPALEIHGGPKLLHTVACARRFIFRTGMPMLICEEDREGSRILEPTYADHNISVWSIPVKARGQSGGSKSSATADKSQSPDTIDREQKLRAEVVKNMFDSDWRKDRLVESRFDEVKLPALIWTRNPDTKDLDHFQCTTMADAPHLQPDARVFVRNPWPASLVQELPPVDNLEGSLAMSYIVRGRPQRGKFLPQKAKALGVTPGPDNARLAAGESITLENGTVITPDMVLAETEPGKGMAVFDIPTDEYLDDLAEKLETLAGGIMSGLGTVSWLLGKDVALNPTFTSMVKSLAGFQHVISSPDVCPNYLALESAAASSTRLAQILPGCFKTPVHCNENQTAQAVEQVLQYIRAEPGLIVQAAPKFVVNKAEVPAHLDVEEIKAVYPSILEDLMPTQIQSNEPAKPHDDVEILTLGTGSAVPSKYRNVSATLVRIPGLGSYLFDCGENTLGSLRRAYTDSELDEVLADLRLIWISHLHADHHLGTISIIEAKREVMQRLGKMEPKLHLISEPNMADYLNDYNTVQSSSHCELLGVTNSRLFTKNLSSPSSEIQISETSLPIKEFLTTSVSHCHGAQACSVTFDNGFKFSYSGDCRPSAQFAKIGQNSDVLLHEATFDDGLEGDAKAKKHSTTAEALAVAYAMKAKNVVLTHFSQRYQKIPKLNNVKFSEVQFEEGNDAENEGPIEEHASHEISAEVSSESMKLDVAVEPSSTKTSDSVTVLQEVARDMSVCVAFDIMSIKVGQIRDMYRYYPAIEKMFELEQEKSDVKRGERREANEKIKEEKEKRLNKWKGTKDHQAKPVQTKGGDIYERINRGKSKQNTHASSSVTHSGTDASNGNDDTGEQHVSNTTSRPSISNRTRKRQTKRMEAERQKNEASNTNQQDPTKLGAEEDVHRSTRQLSPEPETTQRKRRKTIAGEPAK